MVPPEPIRVSAEGRVVGSACVPAAESLPLGATYKVVAAAADGGARAATVTSAATAVSAFLVVPYELMRASLRARIDTESESAPNAAGNGIFGEATVAPGEPGASGPSGSSVLKTLSEPGR